MLAVDERLKGSRGGTTAGCPQGLLTYRLPDDARHSQPAPGPVLLANATAANLGAAALQQFDQPRQSMAFAAPHLWITSVARTTSMLRNTSSSAPVTAPSWGRLSCSQDWLR
jgi:hypothetical protein